MHSENSEGNPSALSENVDIYVQIQVKREQRVLFLITVLRKAIFQK
jgi:hypothetical protein